MAETPAIARRFAADYVVPCEGTGLIIPGGAVDLGADGSILAVGPESDLEATEAPIDRVGGLLMPGLVNTHAHTPMTLLRSAGDGLPLQRWLTEAIWPREGNIEPDDVYWGMVLGSIEMLSAGVTTSNEMYLHEERMVDAVRDTGARVLITGAVIGALLPDGNVEPRMAELSDFHAAHHRPAERINVGFAGHSLYDLSPAQVGEIAARARAVGGLFHIHLAETEVEGAGIREQHGASATQLLADCGALDGKIIAAHGVWLDDDEMALLGQAGAAVAHCPQSNLKLGSGIARVNAMLDAGITVAVATDGVASNDGLDLWEEVRLAPLLARGRAHDPAAMNATTALDLATRSAGLALGMPDLGELRPGARADIIRVDLDVPAFVPGRIEDLLTHVVFAGGARFVTDVWVDGQRVVDDGTCTTFDVDRAIAEATERGRRLAAD